MTVRVWCIIQSLYLHESNLLHCWLLNANTVQNNINKNNNNDNKLNKQTQYKNGIMLQPPHNVLNVSWRLC